MLDIKIAYWTRHKDHIQ